MEETLPSRPPVIVLVRPQLGRNIGMAARAMANFGLAELRLVAPRDGWPNPEAGPAAAGADHVLGGAAVFERVADAVADCVEVYATTVRPRADQRPVITPREAAREMHGRPGPAAVLFGPERSGLEADDLAPARAIVTVPVAPGFGSLNVAQAVLIVGYEWFQARDAPIKASAAAEPPPATAGEIDGWRAQLEAALEDAGWFHPPDRAPAARRALARLLGGPRWTSDEVRMWRGIVRALARR